MKKKIILVLVKNKEVKIMNITEDMYKLIEGKVPETVNEIRNRTLNCFIDLFDEELDTEFTKYRERWKQRQLNQ